MDHQYFTGFGSYIESEAKPGALPIGQNSPQKVPFDLYAEQLSGSAFTAPRPKNLRSWFYRLQPSVVHGHFQQLLFPQWISPDQVKGPINPEQFRWSTLPYPEKALNFIESIVTYAVCGSMDEGVATHMYACSRSMEKEFFYNSDGDLLIVPEQGTLLLKTEFGDLKISPKEIAVIPKGIKFQVILMDGTARGYICENYGAPFVLPDLGPIGANGLANPRDFQIPKAKYEQKAGEFLLINKFQGNFWQAPITHSPLNVVAWHGNYFPYQYDLTRFNTMNSVSYDHADPSIFTVLTSPSAVAGTANVDFVIFPERWVVAEHTFRPPYYHRNIMSECMGLILGTYDAKEAGFNGGGISIHNAFSAHGPDEVGYQKALNQDLKPDRYQNTLAFMFESRFVWRVTDWAMLAKHRQTDYLTCWQNLKSIELL